MLGKSLKFILTHNIDIKLPDILFDSASLKISPKYYEGGGLVAKLEIIPNDKKFNTETGATPRIFFKKISKLLIFGISTAFDGILVKVFRRVLPKPVEKLSQLSK